MMAVRTEQAAEHAEQKHSYDEATLRIKEAQVRFQNVSEHLEESRALLKIAMQESWLHRSRLEECQSEIARMSDMIAQLQDTVVELEQRSQFLLKVGQFLLKDEKWWWRFMPLGWKRCRRDKELMKRKIFNTFTYIERYPDVLFNRQDPFRHFIYHGIAENRKFD